MADGCLLLLEDGSGYLLLESSALLLETDTGLLALEDADGTLLLEHSTDRLLLEKCPGEPSLFGGWAEPAVVRENEADLVVAVIHALRGRRRLTVG